MKKDTQKSQVVIYQTEDGQAKAELFEKSKSTINEHIQNIVGSHSSI